MAQPAGATRRRRRDGRPVETIPEEARRAEPPPIPGTAAAFGLTAATLGPAAGGALAAGQVLNVAGMAAPEAIALSGAAILSSFERFLDARGLVTEADVNELLEEEFADVPEETRLEAVDEEIQRDRGFRAKTRARLDRDLPRVLQIPDPAVAQTELLKLLERERRYAEAREEAIALRSLGNLEARIVEARSPEGGYWWPSPHVAEHTLDCLAMGWKVWPWTVLRTYHPPLHPGCPCEILPIRDAVRQGLPGADLRPNPEMAFHAMQVQEAPWDPEELEEELRVLEARYDRRWGVGGGSKRGQFRPRRGGVPGRVGLRGLRRRRTGLMDVIPAILGPGNEPTIVRRKASTLNVDDEVFVNGKWQKVWGLPSDREGVVDLEDDGPVYFDPDVEISVRTDDPVREPHVPRKDPPPAGVPTWKDAEKVATMDEPDAPGEVGPGFRYVGGEGKSRVEDDQVVLSGRFFRLGAERRREFVFRHLGRRLRDAIPEDRRRELEEHPRLKGKKFEDSYLALNTELGDRLRDMHPDAMAELAREARVHGFPLRDDVDDWMERRDDDVDADGEPLGEIELEGAARLAERLEGMEYGEAFSLMQESGYQEVFDTYPRVWRSFDERAQITGHFDDAEAERPKITKTETRPMDDVPGFLDSGLYPADVDAAMTDGGFGASTRISAGQDRYYYEYVHPDGRGAAVEFVNDETTGTVVGFNAEREERRQARKTVVSRDPLKGVQVGDNWTEIEQILGPWTSWSQRNRQTGGDLPEGWAGFVDYKRARVPGDPADEVRIAYGPFVPSGTEEVAARDIAAGDRITVSGKGDPWRVVSAEPGVGGRGRSFLLERGSERIQWGRNKTDKVERHKGGDNEIVAVGRPNNAPDVKPNDVSIIDEATYQENEKLRLDKIREEEERVKAREAAGDEKLIELLGARNKKDKAKLDRELVGRNGNEIVVKLRDKHNWQVVGSRRGRSKDHGRIVTYTLRSPEGDTLRVQSGLYFGDAGIKAVTGWEPAPEIDAQRITGRVPESIKEWEGDSLARVDELAERFDAVGHVSTILHSQKRGHTAVREFGGTIRLGKGVKPSVDRYLKKKAAGETLTDEDLLDAYSAFETMQHEINHGVTAPGGERTLEGKRQGSFTMADYQGSGKAWEEALTEESAHLLTADWLRSYGATDVLEAVKRHPEDSRVKGVYRSYRKSFGKALDEANVPQEERAELIFAMKFRMTPKQRYEELGKRLRAADAPMAKRTDMRTGQPMDDRKLGYYAVGGHEGGYMSDFEPVVRPDLSDIELPKINVEVGDTIHANVDGIETDVVVKEVVDEDRIIVTGAGRTENTMIEARDILRAYPKRPVGGWTAKAADGKTIRESSLVNVGVWDGELSDLAKIEGVVVEVMAGGNYVRVELPDGTALWYSVTRIWGGR